MKMKKVYGRKLGYIFQDVWVTSFDKATVNRNRFRFMVQVDTPWHDGRGEEQKFSPEKVRTRSQILAQLKKTNTKGFVFVHRTVLRAF